MSTGALIAEMKGRRRDRRNVPIPAVERSAQQLLHGRVLVVGRLAAYLSSTSRYSLAGQRRPSRSMNSFASRELLTNSRKCLMDA